MKFYCFLYVHYRFLSLDFFANTDLNRAIFDFVDLCWSLLSKFTKIANFLSQFGIQSLFNIILINFGLKLKICEFGNCFDTNLCVFQ